MTGGARKSIASPAARFLGIVILCVLAGAAAGLATAFVGERQYEATARVALGNADRTGIEDAADRERAIATQRRLIVSDAVRRGAERRLRLRRIDDSAGLARATKVRYLDDDVAVVATTSTRRTAVAPAANAYADAFLDARRNRRREELERLASRLDERTEQALRDREAAIERVLPTTGTERDQLLSRARALDARYQRLQDQAEAAFLAAENPRMDATLVRSARTPPGGADEELRNGLIGAGGGLVVGLLLGFLLAPPFAGRATRVSRQDGSTLAEFFDVPLLASIGRTKSLSGTGPTMPDDLPIVQAEAFRMLAATIRHANSDHAIRTVLFTSPTAGEGKSTVAFNLAALMTSAGRRVLLLETDLRLPTLGDRLGLPLQVGLGDVLSGTAALSDVTTQIPVTAAAAREQRLLDVVLAGRGRRPAGELLDSPRMSEVLEEAAGRYELVVVDTPPMAVVADAIPLLRQVDGVLLVGSTRVRLGAEAARLREILRTTHAPVMGVVANFVSPREGDTYGYGDGSAQAADEPFVVVGPH